MSLVLLFFIYSVVITLKETAMVLEGMTIDRKPLKDHLEAVGHRDAFLYVMPTE